MITPKGVKYEHEENEFELPFDMPKLVSDDKSEFPDYRNPVQRGHRVEAIHPDTKEILREPMGWCAVIDIYMHPMEDCLRGPLCKPRLEVQARAALRRYSRPTIRIYMQKPSDLWNGVSTSACDRSERWYVSGSLM